MTIHLETTVRRYSGAVVFCSAPSHTGLRVTQTRGTEFFETRLECKHIGESINEDKIILGQASAGLSVKSHCPKKDGVVARLPAAKTVAAGLATLTKNAKPGDEASNRDIETDHEFNFDLGDDSSCRCVLR